MRNPRRWRLGGTVACVLGIAMVVCAVTLPEGAIPTAWHGVLFAVGVTAAVLALCLAASAHRAARAETALELGVDELARWRVDAATWQAFMAAERSAWASDAALPNELAPPDGIPAEGIEVVIGKDAIDIGGSIHVLPRHGAPEVLEANLRDAGGVDVADLHLRHPPTPRSSGGMNPAFHSRLTFPLAPGAWRDARRAIGYYSLGRPGKPSFMHGRGDGSDPEDLNTCDRCGHQTHQYRGTCPQCGGTMLTRRWARRFGAVLIVLGGGLTIGMTALLAYLSPLLTSAGVEVDGTRFNGTAAQAMAIWAVLGAVWIFGATASAQGVYQVVTGRRDKRVLIVWYGLAAVVAVAVAALVV